MGKSQKKNYFWTKVASWRVEAFGGKCSIILVFEQSNEVEIALSDLDGGNSPLINSAGPPTSDVGAWEVEKRIKAVLGEHSALWFGIAVGESCKTLQTKERLQLAVFQKGKPPCGRVVIVA